jgi:hypothetical protein
MVAVRLSLVIAVSFEAGTVTMGFFRWFAGAAAVREAPPGFEPGVEVLQFYPTLCILSSTVASDMLAELREANQSLAARLREAHNVCEEHRDIATTSLIEVWVDETERRTMLLRFLG